MIENRTEQQLKIQKEIIKQLNSRPQMPIRILNWVLKNTFKNLTIEETQLLVDDLEYRWSIVWRVSKDFLNEAEAKNIQLIQEELAKRLSAEKIDKLSVYDLEKMLEAALVRKQKLEWWENISEVYKWWDNAKYIDKLLNLPSNNT